MLYGFFEPKICVFVKEAPIFYCTVTCTIYQSIICTIFFCEKYTFCCICALAHSALQLPLFFLFPFSTGLWTDCLKLFSKRFNINYQGSMWPRSDSFVGHTKKYFHKNCSWSCYLQGVWHMTRLKHGNQHSQHPKKHKKEQETCKQVSQLVSGWKEMQGSKQREIKLISKKVWRKRRCSDQEVDCYSMWRNIKAVSEEHLSSENVV